MKPNAQAIKRALMRRFGWSAVRRDRSGNWWVRSTARPENGFAERWEDRPIWTDADIDRMLADREILLPDHDDVLYAARLLGRKGGQSTSRAKKAAARANGRKGGRPKKPKA